MPNPELKSIDSGEEGIMMVRVSASATVFITLSLW